MIRCSLLPVWAGIAALTAFAGEVAARPGAGPAGRGAADCPGDANDDGRVNFADITKVLENWATECCPSETPCDDGDPCTTDDICFGSGVCGGVPIDCDDGNPCTQDVCCNGVCVHVALPGCVPCCADGDCDDGDACTLDQCVNGACMFVPRVCDDGNPCTTDSCDPAAGCVFTPVPNNTACGGGGSCVVNGLCMNGVCVGTPVQCPEDNNVCTTATCVQGVGCTFVFNTAACDDGNPCTINDTCSNGVCAGTPLNCNDGNPCTTDTCDAATGMCLHTPNSASCSDGNPCTTGDTCSGGVCIGGPPTVCNDNNPCTTDSCNSVTGCIFTPSNGAACSDNSACTINDTCVNGVCMGTPVQCPEDNDVCTTATCVAAVGCTFMFNNSVCDDGDPCTVNDVCVSGVCRGTLMPCSDNNICTNDICVNGVCMHVNNTAACNDGNACTLNDICQGGVCMAGVPRVCTDNNPCTTDSCSPVTGCIFTPTSGAACSDNNACTINDTCVNGVCMGTPVQCTEDNDVCTTATCVAATGCTFVFNSAACDDGNPCTINDTCANGVCSGTPVTCPPGLVCRNGVCVVP